MVSYIDLKVRNLGTSWLTAWLIAFGIFGKVLPRDDEQYRLIHERLDGIELADSITVDGHKLLNVVSTTSAVETL